MATLKEMPVTVPPPPYTVDSRGSTYLQTTARERHNATPDYNRQKISILNLMFFGSTVIILLCAFACMISLYRNTKLMEENLKLLEAQVHFRLGGNTIENDDFEIGKRFDRMISLKDACPPCECTTDPPTPIEPHRNPVTVLNNEVGKNAVYNVLHTCIDPPISEATLQILNDPAFSGKSWSAKGRSKQEAKQGAAWKAITNDLSHLIGLVADEYKPQPYNPPCNKPSEAVI